MDDVETPGLLAGAAGEFCGASDAGCPRIPGGDAASELLFDHFSWIICRESFSLELGGALFEESRYAFPEVFRGARDALRFEFQIELLLVGIFRTVSIEFSDQRQRDCSAIRQIMRQIHCL